MKEKVIAEIRPSLAEEVARINPNRRGKSSKYQEEISEIMDILKTEPYCTVTLTSREYLDRMKTRSVLLGQIRQLEGGHNVKVNEINSKGIYMLLFSREEE